MNTNDPLGDLIDNLIDVTIDRETPKEVSQQLEPIIDGLVELLRGEPQGGGLIDYRRLIDIYFQEQFIKALTRGEIAEA